MDEKDKKELLEAIGSINKRFDGLEQRFDGLEQRFDGFEDRFANLTQEVRLGFERLDTRLTRVEEELAALSKTVDSLIEGDALGKEHITLTRKEYDALVKDLQLPNRFAKHT